MFQNLLRDLRGRKPYRILARRGQREAEVLVHQRDVESGLIRVAEHERTRALSIGEPASSGYLTVSEVVPLEVRAGPSPCAGTKGSCPR